MAEVNAKDLTTKTAPASTDSMLLFGTTSNEGAKITVDNLANNILERIATKTFPNQVGGSSAATILAQLATLNTKTTPTVYTNSADCAITSNYTISYFRLSKIGKVVFLNAMISNGGEAFPTSRTTILNMADAQFQALYASFFIVPAATSVNSFLNRHCMVGIRNAEAIIDNPYGVSDIKEIAINVAYIAKS